MQLEKKEIILNEILKLSPIEKVEIVEEILSSFELQGRKEIDELWAVEVEKRINDYEVGINKTKPFNEVFSDLKIESKI